MIKLKEPVTKPLYNEGDCIPITDKTDLAGEILVLKTDFFYEEYKRPDYQIVFCEHGYKKSDRVYCHFLIDKETADYEPEDFIGILKPELVPDWAARRARTIINRKLREARAAVKLAAKLETKGAFLYE